MPTIPLLNPNHITLTKEEVDQIFEKIIRISNLTDNPFIVELVEEIEKILNK